MITTQNTKVWQPPLEIHKGYLFLEDELAIKMDDKLYYWKNPTQNIYKNHDRPIPINNKNYFLTGMRNIFLWSDDDDFGYKIFTKGWNHRKRVYKNLHNFFDRNCGFSKKEATAIHHAHNYLSDLNLTPKSYSLVNFNFGSFYGAKIEKITGDPAFKDVDECRSELHFKHHDFFMRIRQALVKMAGPRWRSNKFQYNPANYILSLKDNRLYWIDLEWKHMKQSCDRIYESFGM